MKSSSLIGANIHGVRFFPIGASEETATVKPVTEDKSAPVIKADEKPTNPTVDVD